MQCPKCGRETVQAKLSFGGAQLDCWLCLGCNHLYLRAGAEYRRESRGQTRAGTVSGSAVPLIECCELTAEQEKAAKRLLGS
ncbi:MAG: hypothetical protein ACM3X6_13065 [Patescibacteria group bacterium]